MTWLCGEFSRYFAFTLPQFDRYVLAELDGA